MASTVIDADFKVQIPQEVREQLQLEPGHEVAWLPAGGSFRLVRVRTLEALRGTLRGVDWADYRDESDRSL